MCCTYVAQDDYGDGYYNNEYDDCGSDDDRDCNDFNQHWQFCGFQLQPLAL